LNMGPKIGLCGSYGGMNLGDEAILEVILQELKKELGADVTVFSKNPEDTQNRHKVRALPVGEMHKDEIFAEFKKMDLFLVGGGGILYEGMAEQFLRQIQWARECGLPVVLYAVGAGPFSSAETKNMTRDTLNSVDMIILREQEAKKALNDIGVEKPMEVTADPALLLQPEPFEKEKLEKIGIQTRRNAPLVGFSVREPGQAAPDIQVEQYHEVIANAADFMVERFKAQILFVPMERRAQKDLQNSHAIIAKMVNAQSAHVLNEELHSSQILGLMKHIHFAVGMRLHFLIFAALQRVPFVPLPYASKITGFLQSLDMPMPPLKEINAGKLCAFLDRCWDGRQSIRQRLIEKMPPLQKQAARNIKLLKEFLKTYKKTRLIKKNPARRQQKRPARFQEENLS